MEGMMKLTKSERMELQRQAAAQNARANVARHARLILLLADGLTWAEVRAKLDCSDSYIDRWSKRFAAERLAGLFCPTCGPSALAFLTDIVANQPKRKEIHVIADNLSAHKTPKVGAFLDEHPNVHLHFTPT
jgi:Homeodomain-like domain-containing protein